MQKPKNIFVLFAIVVTINLTTIKPVKTTCHEFFQFISKIRKILASDEKKSLKKWQK
jgi:hypothetical protein